jgi:formyltetrahydrofolate hydrolase
MEKILETSTSKFDVFVVNETLNGKNKVSKSSKKLEEAKAFIAKHGLPEGWDSNDSISISGVIKEVNADKNTFVISVQSSDEKKNSKYLVVTIAEKLNDLVRKYWGDSLTISIKPVMSNGQAKQYELIEVQ